MTRCSLTSRITTSRASLSAAAWAAASASSTARGDAVTRGLPGRRQDPPSLTQVDRSAAVVHSTTLDGLVVAVEVQPALGDVAHDAVGNEVPHRRAPPDP